MRENNAFENHSYGGWKQVDVAGTLRSAGGDYGVGSENLIVAYPSVYGCICARDAKGVCNQFVDEGKLVVLLKNDKHDF